MWYDEYKEERILIMKTDTSNKFWGGYHDETNNNVYVRWGRIGTKGQSQIKKFGSTYQAANFLRKKYLEKEHEGYVNSYNGNIITKAIFDKLNLEASIIGTSNICRELSWCDIQRIHNNYNVSILHPVKIADNELMNPNITPGIIIRFSTNKYYNGKNNFDILFDFDKFYDIDFGFNEILEGTDLYKLLTKFSEVICKVLI